MKRREFLSLLAGTVAPWPTFAFAQQNQAAKRIGLMANLPLPRSFTTFADSQTVLRMILAYLANWAY